MERLDRRRFLAVAATAGVSLSGCTGYALSGDEEDEGDEPTANPRTEEGIPLAESALPVEYDFAELREEVRSGGPPKDGIPSIDEPSFWSAAEAADELDDRDVVFGVARGETVKAYPQKVLVWHEITNDVVDGDPVSVTYCPLTGTAMGFFRGETTFGVSGNLLNNNLVMYDRETDSRWPQVLGTAISGELEGESLREFRLVWTRWGDWNEAHPETEVLSTDTDSARNYGDDPYGSYVPDRAGYYIDDSTLFPTLQDDDRFPGKHVVTGARTDEGAVAFDKSSLREQGLLTGAVGETPHLAAYDPALDTAYVYRNPDEESFEYEGNEIEAEVVGPDGTAHAPDDLPLERAYAFDAMWFAWVGFYPSTVVVE